MFVTRRLFEFQRDSAATQSVVEGIRRFAAHPALRSARVEELELQDDFCRRALRPEDLSFIDFSRPVTAETVTQLPFLAAQRLLLSIYELDVVQLAGRADAAELRRYASFHEPAQRVLGARIRPFLESFVFEFIEPTRAARSPAEVGAELQALAADELAFWGRVWERLLSTGYTDEGLRFVFIQCLGLAPSKRIALRRALAAGYFEALPGRARPRLGLELPDVEGLKTITERCGFWRGPHSYWQFYLSTSLASCNLLQALAQRPDASLALCGASFAFEIEWRAFGEFLARALQHAGAARRAPEPLERGLAGLVERAQVAAGSVLEQYGPARFDEFARGAQMAVQLARSSRLNLGRQLRWLSSMPQHQRMAELISERIARECPNIDRETFVEPREMCSTTHVHDDHRLVVIESGKMAFWGNLGMKLRLDPGERVLVPQGRLHGSSIESAECTYHQPIIPPAWVEEMLNELDPSGAGLEQRGARGS